MYKRGNKKESVMHTFKMLIVIVLLFLLVCYIFFAVIPECFDFSFPTGGWDWLSFVGALASIIIASWGVSVTIESSRKVAEEEAFKAVKPIINVSVFNDCNSDVMKNNQGVYLPYSVDGGTIELKDNFCYFSNMTQKRNDKSRCLLQFKNIGLGSALNIEVKIYKLYKLGQQSINDYKTVSVENFYKDINLNKDAKRLKFDSKKACKITENVYFAFPPFHLNSTTDSYSLVLGQQSFSGGSAYYIFDIMYTDVYESKTYRQYHHLRFEESICKYYSTSSQIVEDVKI